MTTGETQVDPVQEAARVLDRAEEGGLVIRAAGGVAVALLCPSARRPPLARSYQDVDFVVDKSTARRIGDLFGELGYVPDQHLNALQGGERLHFMDPENELVADVFVESIRGCHEIALKDRLGTHPRTLPPVDLVFSKLQIRETNRKDQLDLIALFTDIQLSEGNEGIDVAHAARMVGSDWGLWRTTTEVLRATIEVAGTVGAGADAGARMGEFLEVLETAPKSRRWRARARVGDRVRWYEEPEEVEP